MGSMNHEPELAVFHRAEKEFFKIAMPPILMLAAFLGRQPQCMPYPLLERWVEAEWSRGGRRGGVQTPGEQDALKKLKGQGGGCVSPFH